MDNEIIRKAELTPEEQNEFKGGMLCAEVIGDVENTNRVSLCECSYNNRSAIRNTNDVCGCICSCI